MPVEPPAPPRRQQSAILFADVHGYSGLMSRNEVRTYERVNQAVRLIKSLIGDYGGRVEHVAGDGVLALFESAARALHFAVAIQREFRNDVVWHAEDAPIAFRIGINVGDVLVDDDANVQGHSVNVAARIQALARPGGICITEAVQRAVRDIPGLEFRPLGPQAPEEHPRPGRGLRDRGQRPAGAGLGRAAGAGQAGSSIPSRRYRSPSCRSQTSPTIPATAICATASRPT